MKKNDYTVKSSKASEKELISPFILMEKKESSKLEDVQEVFKEKKLKIPFVFIEEDLKKSNELVNPFIFIEDSKKSNEPVRPIISTEKEEIHKLEDIPKGFEEERLKIPFKYLKKSINNKEKQEFNSEFTNTTTNGKDFLINNLGILCIKEENSISKVANFYIEALAIKVKDDGLNKTMIYSIKCTLFNGEKKIISITNEDLFNGKWIVEKLGVKYCQYESVEKDNYEVIRRYLAEQFSQIPEQIEYAQVGWRKIENQHVYLHANSCIGGNLKRKIKGSINKTIEVDFKLSQIEATKESLLLINMSNDLRKTVVPFLFTHLSIMKELFIEAQVKPEFLLWIYGLTGSMKTTVSKIFFNIFNRSNMDYLTATFKDTIASIEIKAFEYKDSILLIDDYHPSSSYSEKKDMQSKASNIIRIYGDNISKSRATRTMKKQSEFPPRGLCVITGEDTLEGESTVARYIGIEVNQYDFNTNIISYHQNNPLIFSTHLYYFINWLSYNYEWLVEFIKKEFQSFRNINLGCFRHKRFIEMYSILHVTGLIFNLYLKYLNMKYNQISFDNIIFNTIDLHEKSTTNQNPAYMYLIAIQQLVEGKKITLLNKKEPNEKNSNIVGYYDEDKFYFIPNLIYESVRAFWKNQGIEFPVSMELVHKDLEELKVIETAIEKYNNTKRIRRTIKIKLNRKSIRVLVIYREKMAYILENI